MLETDHLDKKTADKFPGGVKKQAAMLMISEPTVRRTDCSPSDPISCQISSSSLTDCLLQELCQTFNPNICPAVTVLHFSFNTTLI